MNIVKKPRSTEQILFKNECRRCIAQLALFFGYMLKPYIVDYVYSFGPFHRQQLSLSLRAVPLFLRYHCILKQQTRKHTFKRVFIQILHVDTDGQAKHGIYIVSCARCARYVIVNRLFKFYHLDERLRRRVMQIEVDTTCFKDMYITVEIQCDDDKHVDVCSIRITPYFVRYTFEQEFRFERHILVL